MREESKLEGIFLVQYYLKFRRHEIKYIDLNCPRFCSAILRLAFVLLKP